MYKRHNLYKSPETLYIVLISEHIESSVCVTAGGTVAQLYERLLFISV